MAPGTHEETLEDLPPSSKFIYKVLDETGPLTLKGISEQTLLSTRTARYGLQKLEEEGLVESAPALHDGRQQCYSLVQDECRHPHEQYARGVLVDVDWLCKHRDELESDDPDYRLVEVGDTYGEGHAPGAVDLSPDALMSPNQPGIPDREAFADLLGRLGITADTTVVAYGRDPEFAAFFYWVLKYYGHRSVRLLDGGKRAWVSEDGREILTDPFVPTTRTYEPIAINENVRAYRDDVRMAIADEETTVVDVRSREEYVGDRRVASDGDPTPRVAGHIPGTTHVPWTSVLNGDGAFRDRHELERLFEDAGVTPGDDVIVYCNVGERSALVWFVLCQLLGYSNVANYDGSWAEWGNLIDAPIETGL
jgi:thiosulfate/3-mercaptopyruvate sulfurtransferase